MKLTPLSKAFGAEITGVDLSSLGDSLFEDIMDDEAKQKLKIIHSEYPYFHFDRDYFYQKQKYIKKKHIIFV